MNGSAALAMAVNVSTEYWVPSGEYLALSAEFGVPSAKYMVSRAEVAFVFDAEHLAGC